MRAFLAIPMPEDTATAMLEVQSRLPTGRPVPEDNLHLTLAFLGEVGEEVLADMDETLSATRLPVAEIAFGGLDTFAEMERGLAFVSVLHDDGLAALQAKVERIARMAGAALPRRRFRPHVTLMRSNRQPGGPARDRMAAALGMPVDIPGFTATELVLYRSTLQPGGALHEPLESYPLSPF
ncbi:RNA 2',3'-cyclic phosphodiesterase [Roseibacterium sp. SDUM158017]|uniref:RNA 2',3'-cyclic phosphodiesterase n=1 Tax=Roseicyclus salinarum TaxID=3036773 RepID=UPI0024151C54|nr:RNA 2',3'-cyclic phosphodiesterase [Roseibacterium sp. SDUM158017]MDG4649044.1 RNA 2',3'-cyclic phosphodiesterase [Roseibacterium sp. SDUM158017]